MTNPLLHPSVVEALACWRATRKELPEDRARIWAACKGVYRDIWIEVAKEELTAIAGLVRGEAAP